ncbi:hypothetical protein RF11_02994 [Thelohanellus kitauei]|uniref:DDE-1 domain-containing protein n=1 Tax=Thelohanellus kitauei TaxID=669202 RepID=A0A0C2MXN2_THEKT|nr:hypothetical protein RF11_02994 [Thelohanellus kitauei]
MPRNDLTLSIKIAMLDKMKSQCLNTSYRRLAEITGVQNLHYRMFYDKKVNCAMNWFYKNDKQKLPKEHATSKAQDKWFSIVSGKSVNINGPRLRAKSEELAKKPVRNDFKETDNFCANDIYSADDSGLYYRDTPDGSLCYKHVALPGHKKGMDRISVFWCTNMSGTGKRKLLIIEKSASTRFFKEPRMEGLPVEYHANKNAKILLVVDNSAAHTHLDNLQNIGLEFLPRNTTSLVQTMDMGMYFLSILSKFDGIKCNNVTIASPKCVQIVIDYVFVTLSC